MKIYYNRFGKSVLNKQLWWCVFVIYKIELILMSTLSYHFIAFIQYTKTLVSINYEEINTIMYSRKSLLFDNTDIWIKKNGDTDFDVTMGSFDCADLCELVRLYILHILGEKYGKHRIGLCRDDGLACFGYTSGPQADRIRKYFIKIFKE